MNAVAPGAVDLKKINKKQVLSTFNKVRLEFSMMHFSFLLAMRTAGSCVSVSLDLRLIAQSANIIVVLAAAKDIGVQVTNVGAEDIMEGRVRCSLGSK